MNANRIVQPYIDKARNDLQAARQDTVELWGRSDTNSLALVDVRDILESLTRACASLAKGLEQLSNVTAVTYDEEPIGPLEDIEPDVDDEPPPDYGPPGSGAVITEYPF